MKVVTEVEVMSPSLRTYAELYGQHNYRTIACKLVKRIPLFRFIAIGVFIAVNQIVVVYKITKSNLRKLQHFDDFKTRLFFCDVFNSFQTFHFCIDLDNSIARLLFLQ